MAQESRADRLDGFQRRHRWLGFPIAVIYKFADDQGNYLAALMTYYAFLSLFPLLLMASSILGFVLQGNPELQQTIIESALGQFPVIGDQLGRPGGLKGNTFAVVIGALGSLYGALGVAQATQNAMNIAWAVPRNQRPNPVTVRIRSLVLLATSGIAILLTTMLAAIGSNTEIFGIALGPWFGLLVSTLAVVLHAAVFVLLFRLATTHKHSLKRAVPGAVFAAVLWQALQLIGSVFVTHIIDNASVAYGTFAVVLGMIAYIYLAAMVVVFGVEINVVKAHRLHPRALMTPFTDNVNLTVADQRAYADYAAATRSKGFQEVDVSFAHAGQYASARLRAQSSLDASGIEPVREYGDYVEPLDESEPEPVSSTKPHKHY